MSLAKGNFAVVDALVPHVVDAEVSVAVAVFVQIPLCDVSTTGDRQYEQRVYLQRVESLAVLRVD